MGAPIRGNAAIKWTDTDDISTERVLLLREPLREFRSAHSQAVFAADSLDFTQRQVFTVGEGVDELIGRLRFGDHAQGLLDLIKAGSKGRTLTYIPDLDDPDRNASCYLIAPLSPLSLAMDPDTGSIFGDQDVDLRLRKTSGAPFTPDVQSQQVLFSFVAGGRMEEATFSRGAKATHVVNTGGGGYGTLSTASTVRLRLTWRSTNSSVGPRTFPAILLEEQGSNRVKDSNGFNTTNWAWNGTGTLTSAQAGPSSASNAWLLNDASTTALVERRQIVNLNVSTRACGSLHIKAHSTVGTASFRLLTTNAATTHFRATITWSSGRPNIAAAIGTLIGDVERYRNNFYRFAIRTTGTLTTGNRFLSIRPASTAAGAKGGLLIYGAQVEN